jgi:hypothetical protein
MTDARAQLLSTIEGAVSQALDRHLPGFAEDLADRLAASHPNGSTEPEWIDAAEVARRYSVSRDYVYEHAEKLGVERMGDGPKARLRFNPAKVADALAPRPHPLTEPERPKPRPRRGKIDPSVRTETLSEVELLPIRGER